MRLSRLNSGEIVRNRTPESFRIFGIALELGPAVRFASLGCLLWIVLGVCLGQTQPVSPSYFSPTIAEGNASEERERRWRANARRAAQRIGAHLRLGSAANTTYAPALCPVFSSSGPDPRQSVRDRPGPLEARSVRRPAKLRWRGVAPASQSASTIFSEYISESIVQSKCINCHVKGGISGHTRLVLSPSDVEGHEALNLAVFQNLVSTIEDGADLILNKIQGVGHGGGVQVPAGTADFANMERFLRLLGGGDSTSGLSPETLFDGVTMARPTKTLRRAALIFAGRLPTQAELNAVADGRISSLRRTIRSLMTGPSFHEFLIQAPATTDC